MIIGEADGCLLVDPAVTFADIGELATDLRPEFACGGRVLYAPALGPRSVAG